MAGVALKDIGVWIGIKCVIASLRQARPLCRDSGHKSCRGHKIKRADVLPQSWSSSPKAIKQKLLSKPSINTSFWPKLMHFRLVLFCNLLHAIEAWRTETFSIILINSIHLHIPRPSTRLGRPTVRISSYRYFIHHRLIRNSSVRHFILRRTICSSSALSLNQVLGVLRRH